MEYVLFAVGVIVGSILTTIIRNFRTKSGTLRIDHTNPSKDVYRFEIDDLDSLSKKKRIVLKIDHDANLSQN